MKSLQKIQKDFKRSSSNSHASSPLNSSPEVTRKNSKRVSVPPPQKFPSQMIKSSTLKKDEAKKFTQSDDDSFIEMHSNRYLNDSELESQMDDFMITDSSQGSGENTTQRLEYASFSSCDGEVMSDASGGIVDNVDPETKIIQNMEKFYDENYKNYMVCNKRSILKEQVWNLYYDQNFDIVYIFIAKIEQQKGMMVDCEEGQGHSKNAQLIPFDNIKNANQRSKKSKIDKENDLRKKVFQLYQNCEVSLDIYLEVWNIDDRVLRDANHRARPSSEHKVLNKTEFIEKRMSSFGHMEYLKNKYQDHAQLSQSNTTIFFKCNNKIASFDLYSKQFSSRAIDGENQAQYESKASQMLLHHKDLGKRNQKIESFYFFSYMETKGEINDAGSTSEFFPSKNAPRQRLVLKSINYRQLKSMNSRPKMKYKPIDSKDQVISLKDEELLVYYENKNKRKLKSFFIQRVMESNNYILVFPTGLLLSISVNPLTLQNKINLSLKREESIIDFSYCVQSNFKNHCIWMMDERLQVWKCHNELNPNSCNWIINKITTFDSLYFKRFMGPACTYDEIQMTTSLNGLTAFQQLSLDQGPNLSFIFTYNGTSTKAAIIRQINVREEQIIAAQKVYRDEIYETIRSNKTQLYTIVKNQDIIMAHIPERISLMNRLASTMNFKVSNLVQENLQKQLDLIANQKMKLGDIKQSKEEQHLKDQELQMADIKELFTKSNEIQEIIYMGINKETLLTGKVKKCRQFLVRKTKSLEMMFTNGLNFWTQIISNSQASPPYNISDVVLSNNKKKLIVYYSTPQNETLVQLKTFKMNSSSKQFELYNDDLLKTQVNHKNLTLDQNGQLYEIVIDRINNLRSMNNPLNNIFVDRNGHKLNLRIPDILINNDLFDKQNKLERMIQSDDGRILMCGKLFIKLNKSFDEIELIGCILGKKKQQQNTYKFLSLTNCEDKSLIDLKLQQHASQLVDFRIDQPPLFQFGSSDIIYITHCVDQITGETSVIKMMTEKQCKCYEIYQSKFRTVHSTMQQVEEFQCEMEKNKAQVISSNNIWNDQNLPEEQKKILGNLQNSFAKAFIKKNLTFLSKEDESKNQKVKKNCASFFISLISQSQNHLNIEIIRDYNVANIDESSPVTKSFKLNKSFSDEDSKSSHEEGLFKKMKSGEKQFHVKKCDEEESGGYFELKRKQTKVSTKQIIQYQQKQNHASLQYFINISVKNPLKTTSELGWVNKKTIILTINNEYFVINLRSQNLIQVSQDIYYSVQQVNLGVFCSLVRKIDNLKCHTKKVNLEDSVQISEQNNFKLRQKQNQKLIDSLQSIQRMEIASLQRYCHLRNHDLQHENEMALLFFTPSEELKGGNIFSRVASNYSIMQPYLEKIDAEFIEQMNQNVQNISTFINPEFQIINHARLLLDFNSEENKQQRSIMKNKTFDNVEYFEKRAGHVHMYQSDISGQNVIDYAFKKNAIFCIKAFVETLLILSNEESFANCFDKALLMMISKQMIVKDLVNSELFYVSAWKNQTVFSPNQKMIILPYTGEIEDIQFENPNILFNTKNRLLDNLPGVEEKVHSHNKKLEEFEMQFNYINMEDIQGENKISFSKILKDCSDIELFEQEAIQNIIDYKWDTYGYTFFFNKFVLYFIFLVIYYVDLESLHHPDHEGVRIKGVQFFMRKGVCSIIQLIFFIYELAQIKNEGSEYWEDFWNYFEVAGMLLFYWAATLDYLNDHTTDLMKVLFCFSIIMSLVKIVYLVRVFQQLNFLATMLITVCNEVIFFMVLFSIFLLTFAECNHVLLVDISAYGRTRPLLSHFITMLRCAMGDFSLIDPFQTFDMIDVKHEGGEPYVYRHSIYIVHFTFFIWTMSIFFLFMIFMNFIIAVIGDSYNKVIELKMAYDYQQRIMMIYEREIQFGPSSFEDTKMFPGILIVRKMKTNKPMKSNMSNWSKTIKNYVKSQTLKAIESVNQKTKEQKLHFSNSLKIVENDIASLSSDIQKVYEATNGVLSHLIPQKSKPSPLKVRENIEDYISEQTIHGDQEKQPKAVKIDEPVIQSRQKAQKSPLLKMGSVDGRSSGGKQFTYIQPQNEDFYQVPVVSKKRAQSAKRETMPPKKRMDFSRPNNNPNRTFTDNSPNPERDYNQLMRRMSELESTMNKRFNHIDSNFIALSKENDDLKLSVNILVELQTQSTELMKRNVIQTEKLLKENAQLVQNMNKQLSSIQPQAEAMLSPHRASIASFDVSNQQQLDFLSQRGRTVMNQVNGQNSNLPMTRSQAQYPTLNQKKEKKKSKKQSLKSSFLAQLDNDPSYIKYQKQFLRNTHGAALNNELENQRRQQKSVDPPRPKDKKSVSPYELQFTNEQNQINVAQVQREASSTQPPSQAVDPGQNYELKMSFLKSLQLDSPIDKNDINFYDQEQVQSEGNLNIQEEAKMGKRAKKSVYIYSEEEDEDDEDIEDRESETN